MVLARGTGGGVERGRDDVVDEALDEIFARVDVQGSELLAVHPQPNENAWLLGLAGLRQEHLVGMVGARGVKPPRPTSLFRSRGRCRSMSSGRR